jgi:transcriptional regulator with XRE-family HTH domain
MELKDRIKSLRNERHLSQAQIAKALGIDQSTVSYWEKGRQEPNALQRKKLCQFLGITQSELFKGL